jgi:hypothetical protein
MCQLKSTLIAINFTVRLKKTKLKFHVTEYKGHFVMGKSVKAPHFATIINHYPSSHKASQLL